MDWIERVFGVSPDGGNGMAEMVLAVVIALVLAAGIAVARRSLQSRASRRRPPGRR